MNEELFDAILNVDDNLDLVKRVIEKKSRIVLYYLTSLIDNLLFSELVKTLNKTNSLKSFYNELTIASISKIEEFKKALYFLESGCVIILYEDEVINVDIRNYPMRSVQEPESEKAIRGSKDGFNENLNTNIGLIRRRIKDTSLKVEHHIVSKDSKTSICLLYLSNKVNKKVLKKVQEKIESLNINSLIMTDRALEELILEQQKTIFPLARYTERPDVASISIIKGKIVILVDNSSSSIILPTNLFDHYVNVEEYREPPISGTLTRFIRSISIILSIILLPIFICLVLNKDINNGIIVLKALEISKPILILQVISSIFIMEIFRIASIHTPSSLATGVSFVAAIILGEISMSLGIFLPEILLVVSISMICSFATPSYELSLCNRMLMLILTIVAIFFNYIGLMIGLIILFIHLLMINPLTYAYLYPICPFDYEAFKDIFKRTSARKKENL